MENKTCSSCSTKEPLNGMYMTSADFPQWHDEFSKIYSREELKYRQDRDNLDDDSILVQNVTFVVTERCSLRCTYCYESHDKHACGERMTKDVGERGVDMLFEKDKLNDYFSHDKKRGIILDFIGGEPLLEIDLIDHIVDYFKLKCLELDHEWGYNYMISISTNGVHYLEGKVQSFIRKNYGKTSINITIDGNKELHDSCRLFPDGTGSYDVVKKSVKEWIKYDNNASTKLTLSTHNLQYLNDAIINLYNLGLKGVYANPVFEKGWQIEHARLYYKELKKLADYMLSKNLYKTNYTSLFDETIGRKRTENKNWCGGNGSMLCIAPDGRCFPCLRFMQHSLMKQKEQPIGDIDTGLDSKEENEWLKCLCDITMSSQSSGECIDCPVETGCALCTAYNYDEFGDANVRATFICDMHRARVMGNYYYWTKLYKKIGVDKELEFNIPKDVALNIINIEEFNMLKNLRSR